MCMSIAKIELRQNKWLDIHACDIEKRYKTQMIDPDSVDSYRNTFNLERVALWRACRGEVKLTLCENR